MYKTLDVLDKCSLIDFCPIMGQGVYLFEENNRKVIIYGTIGFYIDAIILAGNILVLIFGLFWELIEKCVRKCNPNQYQDVRVNNDEEEKPYYAEYPSAD